MRWKGRCPCGSVEFAIDGPARAVIVCHCGECRRAAGGPWAASAAYRRDLAVTDESQVRWERAAHSEHGASRGRCNSCGTVVFWDAPTRETVSFGAALLDGGELLPVAAHIWVPEEDRTALLPTGLPVEPRGLPGSSSVPWREAAAPTGTG